MPISVNELLQKVNLRVTGKVKWGNVVDCQEKGIYLISTSSNPESNENKINEAPISREKLMKWIAVSGNMTIDNRVADLESLNNRLQKYWLPDENILYIGQTSKQTLHARIQQFYNHELGRRKPHSGGEWIKTLSNINELCIYFVTSDSSKEVEEKLLHEFMKVSSSKMVGDIQVQSLGLPFANKECICEGKRLRKNHGFGNARI